MLAVRQYSLVGTLLLLSLLACDDSPLDPALEAASGGGGNTVAAPSNPTATPVSESRIDVAWQDNSTNETGFEVHRSTTGAGGPFALFTTTGANTTSYSNSWLSASTEYCYEIRAFRTTGRKATYSQFSAPACATTTAPATPSGVDAKPAGSTYISVRWVDNSTTEEGFQIERSLDQGATWVTAGTQPANVTQSTDFGRASEQPVCYRVIALHSRGNSAPSSPDCTAPPAPPSGLTATGTSQPAIDLAWADNSAVEDGFEVWRTEQSSGFVAVATVPANSTSYHDTAVIGNTRYWYNVRATKDGGVSDFSLSVSAIAVTAPPASPSGVDATPGGSTAIGVRWTDQSTNEEGFRVERSLDGGASWDLAGTTGESQYWFTDVDRTSDQPVCYRVIAFNNLGGSAPSNVDCTTPPAAPTGLTATTVAGLAIDLAWTDNSAVEDGYQVQELVQQCGYYYCYDYVVEVATLGPNVTSYRHAGLNPSEFHRYQVIALKDGGASDASNEAGAWSDLPPAAPSNLSATAVSSGQIDLAWTNTTNDVLVVIERCVGDAVSCDDASFVGLAWTGVNATTYTDTSVQANTTYTYRILAYNGRFSGPSNEATATTLGQDE